MFQRKGAWDFAVYPDPAKDNFSHTPSTMDPAREDAQGTQKRHGGARAGTGRKCRDSISPCISTRREVIFAPKYDIVHKRGCFRESVTADSRESRGTVLVKGGQGLPLDA